MMLNQMRKVIVLGLGVSGKAAAGFLMAKGYEVIGVDCNVAKLKEDPQFKNLSEKGLVVFGEGAPIDLSEIAFLILSPGVSPRHSLLLEAKEKGVEIIGEAEMAFRQMRQPCIGITGTNGKTTVTLLTEHVLRSSGIKARALGNVGDPLISYFLNPDPEEVIVAEMSSYQLETLHTPVFDVAVILNITPDHLDRYATMKEYAKAKCLIKRGLKPGCVLYVHKDVEREFGAYLYSPQIQTYSSLSDAHHTTDKLAIRAGEKVETFLPLSYRQLGNHDCENALAAWLLVRPFGVTAEQFCKSLETFNKPAHRIEFVKKIDGISYYDDSKGTNIDAVIQAVRAMTGPVILIAGGVDKGASYKAWITHFEQKVKCVFVIGLAAEKIERDLKDVMPVKRARSLEEALEHATKSAKRGDCILLSPGCSSFDMFRDYAHRGEEFKKWIYQLEERRIQQ